jgi:hypothetical protein
VKPVNSQIKLLKYSKDYKKSILKQGWVFYNFIIEPLENVPVQFFPPDPAIYDIVRLTQGIFEVDIKAELKI